MTTIEGEGPSPAWPRPSDPSPDAKPKRRTTTTKVNGGDLIFGGLTRSGGLLVLVIMGGIGTFLAYRAAHALSVAGLSFLTTAAWEPDTGHFGIAEVLLGSVLIAIVASVVAIPLAFGTAMFISEVVPTRVRRLCISLIDLMAAIPSVVYGLWGLFFLQGHAIGVARWINAWFGWIPVFHVDGADPSDPLSTASVYTSSTFIAGLVVGMMVMPIMCSIMREGFAQAPVGEREAAYALGSTRWGMIRSVVLPFGRGAIIGGFMLGFGRAMGETIAVYLIISPVFRINLHVLQSGANSVSALIALRHGDSSSAGLSALMAAGLSLFLLVLIVNLGASVVVARSRSGAVSD